MNTCLLSSLQIFSRMMHALVILVAMVALPRITVALSEGGVEPCDAPHERQLSSPTEAFVDDGSNGRHCNGLHPRRSTHTNVACALRNGITSADSLFCTTHVWQTLSTHSPVTSLVTTSELWLFDGFDEHTAQFSSSHTAVFVSNSAVWANGQLNPLRPGLSREQSWGFS